MVTARFVGGGSVGRFVVVVGRGVFGRVPGVRAAGEPARSTSGERLGVWQGRQNYRPARLEDMTEGRQRGGTRADAVERLLAWAVEKSIELAGDSL
jgi:hypothetical protein